MAKKPKNKARMNAAGQPIATDRLAAIRALKTTFKVNVSAAFLLLFGGLTAASMITVVIAALQVIEVSNTLKLQGRLQAIEQSTPIKHDVGGRVKNIFVTEGEMVREGQILISLGTEDLDEESTKARQQMAFLLLKSACLKARRDRSEVLMVPEQLQIGIAKLEQLDFMRKQVRICQNQMDQENLDQQERVERAAELQDRVNLHERLADTSQSVQRRLLTVPKETAQEHPIVAELLSRQQLEKSLRYAISASEIREKLEKLKTTFAKSEANRFAKIDRDLDLVADKLIDAEQTLSRSETLLQRRFVFASTSGRVQRMRISKEGGRIAAGAYVMEIAPLTTDFEVLSRVSVLDIPDLTVGQQVQVRLSGGMPRPVWVPAHVDEILKTSANQRLIRIRLTREDLNKRDLLRGDHSLNGLGEQSEALISVQSESALRSLSGILLRQLKPDQGSET